MLHTLVSLVAVAVGIFVLGWPVRAARIWGWKNLDELGPVARRWYFGVYRAWGVLLCAAGILFEAQSH